jgi:hypothetical protein
MRILSLLVAGIVLCSSINHGWAQSPPGRYQLMPAMGPPIDVRGTLHFHAWRIDTQTGALQMCSYDPGGWKGFAQNSKERLECSEPIQVNEAMSGSKRQETQ